MGLPSPGRVGEVRGGRDQEGVQGDAVRLSHELVVGYDERLGETDLPVHGPDPVGVRKKLPDRRLSGEQLPG